MLRSTIILVALFLASTQAVKINTFGHVGGNGCDFSGLWTLPDEEWHSSPAVGQSAKWQLGKTPNAFGVKMEGDENEGEYSVMVEYANCDVGTNGKELDMKKNLLTAIGAINGYRCMRPKIDPSCDLMALTLFHNTLGTPDLIKDTPISDLTKRRRDFGRAE